MAAAFQTLDQIRAQHAWEMLKFAKSPKDLATTCKKSCSRILTSGFAPTLAFCLTKTDDEHRLVARSLAKHLSKPKHEDPEKLLEELIGSDADRLRKDTEEAMAFLTWLARMADGRAKKEKAEGGGS